jgi:hypothetical protein
VVVDDRQNLGSLIEGGSSAGLLVSTTTTLIAGGHVGHDLGLVQTPAGSIQGGFGVGRAQQDGARRGAGFVQIPGPDDGRAGGIGVGGFVAENWTRWSVAASASF